MDAANRHLRTTRLQTQIKVPKLLAHLNKRAVEGTAQIYCPNPDHPERRASARIYEATNSVHCFKCGKTWDIVGLAALIRQTGRDEAIDWLERAFNLPPIGQSAVDMVSSLVQGQLPASEMGAMMQRLRLAKRSMPKAQYLRAWVLFDAWREGQLDPETAEQVRETLNDWTRSALSAPA